MNANDDLLNILYRNATAFVFPSIYEGFGIPILEAFGCGCPVILSNSSSFPEIAANAALYFDPKNKMSIKDTVAKALFDKKLCAELIEKGFNRVKSFSWEKAAKETIKVYKQILDTNKIK